MTADNITLSKWSHIDMKTNETYVVTINARNYQPKNYITPKDTKMAFHRQTQRLTVLILHRQTDSEGSVASEEID